MPDWKELDKYDQIEKNLVDMPQSVSDTSECHPDWEYARMYEMGKPNPMYVPVRKKKDGV